MKEKLKPGAALVKLRWDKATSQEKAAHSKIMNAARWKGKTEADRKAQGAKMTAGRAKAAEIRRNSAI